MIVAMLTTGIEKRADVRLSAMASAIVSSPTCGSLHRRSAHQVSAATVCTTTDIDINKHAGEHSTDDVNKNETVLNNNCQLEIPAHMLSQNSAYDVTVLYDVTDKESFNNEEAWMGVIDKHVSDSANKILVESKRDLTSQEELPTGEAKELADSVKRAIRVKVPRRPMCRQSCPRSRKLRAVDQEGAVPSSTEIERQRKRHRSTRSAETRQHYTTTRHVQVRPRAQLHH